MIRELFAITAAVAFTALPVISLADSDVSIDVTSDCTLSQNPGGTIAFTPISGLFGTSQSEFAPENVATTQCSASSASLNIYDNSSSPNSHVYVLELDNYHYTWNLYIANSTRGIYGSTYEDYSGPPGITLKTDGTVQNWPMYGEIYGKGIYVQVGSYTDTITLAVTFT